MYVDMVTNISTKIEKLHRVFPGPRVSLEKMEKRKRVSESIDKRMKYHPVKICRKRSRNASHKCTVDQLDRTACRRIQHDGRFAPARTKVRKGMKIVHHQNFRFVYLSDNGGKV